MTSIGAMGLRDALADFTGLDLPATLVFDYPTVVRILLTSFSPRFQCG